MSSTNKTTNYELSQFVGTDKPAWLADYNQDMSKIDTGIHTAQTTATGADGKADANASNIGDLSNLTTSVKTSIVAAVNEVDGHADGAAESANTANTTAQSAKTIADGLVDYLDLDGVNANLTMTAGAGATVSEARFHSAYNTDGTLGKIYGFSQFVKNNTQETTVTISDTGLRPTEAFTISDGVLMYRIGESGTIANLFTANLTVNTDGTATFVIPAWTYVSGVTNYVRAIMQPYLIFAKKFDA